MVTTTWSQTAGMTSETGTDNIEDYAEQAEASKDAAAASEAAAASSASAASTSASSASTDAASALSSKNAAATSETNASTSETNAASSSATASTAATNASTSASNSASSATASANSAASAATSETNAATSETNAAASETAAAGSATSASTSETNAATSETNAAASETAAATSETNAATSETNAATSETNAATSETNSATSETNAASSATAAASSASAASTSATSASNAQTAAESARDATLAAYDNFDDRYLGSKSSDPTVDNDGNPLVAGSIYFNSVSGAMRVYTGSAWVAAYVNGADYLALSGGTMTGDVAYGDNVKATFGASADLQVYHRGDASFIDDVGTGNLNIRAENLNLANSDGSENYIRMNHNGSVDIYYDNSKKLNSTSSGINVTGTVVADGAAIGESTANTTLTVGGSYANGLEIAQNGIDATSSARLFFDSTTDTSAIYNSSGDLTIAKAATINGSSGNKSMTLASNGDISFYEDTGTTAKFFWDASAERLGIGTVSPAQKLDVSGGIKSSGSNTTNGAKLFLENTSFGTYEWITQQEDGGDYVVAVSGTGGAEFKLVSDGADFTNTYALVGNRVKLNSSGSSYFLGGNVGIGTSSPTAGIDINANGSGGTVGLHVNKDNSTGYYVIFEADLGTNNNRTLNLSPPSTDSSSEPFRWGTGNSHAFETDGTERLRINDNGIQVTGSVDFGNWTITESGGSLYFATGGTNKMKLDASGNLDVVGSVNSNATIS